MASRVITHEEIGGSPYVTFEHDGDFPGHVTVTAQINGHYVPVSELVVSDAEDVQRTVATYVSLIGREAPTLWVSAQRAVSLADLRRFMVGPEKGTPSQRTIFAVDADGQFHNLGQYHVVDPKWTVEEMFNLLVTHVEVVDGVALLYLT